MKIISRITFLILIIFLVTGCKNNASTQENVDKIISTFFEKFPVSTNESLIYLFSTNKYIKDNKESIATANNSLTNLTRQLGNYYGYELIAERKVSNSLILRSYLIKYDRQPLRFTFIFYKPNTQWMAFNFFYDDKLDEELKEAAKVYLNNEVYSSNK